MIYALNSMFHSSTLAIGGSCLALLLRLSAVAVMAWYILVIDLGLIWVQNVHTEGGVILQVIVGYQALLEATSQLNL